jgi:hypothetical protein
LVIANCTETSVRIGLFRRSTIFLSRGSEFHGNANQH